MRTLLLKRRKVIIVLICVSFVVSIIIGIKVHLSVDLDALNASTHLMKEGLIHYAEDSKEETASDKESHQKSNQLQHEHNHGEKSFFDAVHFAAIKKGKELKNLAGKKVVEKLSDVGFVVQHEEDPLIKKGKNISVNGLKHLQRRETKRIIDALYGVSPKVAMHYQNKDEFRCLDSNQRFPMSYVNDDYCDCDDGSDEPGTSACSNGRFYCKKDGKHILSSRVNDAICDCCDGSDEWKMMKPIGFILPKMPVMRYAPCNDIC